MGARQFVDPTVLLRVSPLVSATCSLWFSWDQHFFLRLFNEPESRNGSKSVLPTYFPAFFERATPYVVGLLSATMATATANIYLQPTTLIATHSLRWYKAGAMFAFAHVLFVPIIASSVKDIYDRNGDDNDNLERWLCVNAVRGLTVDLAAWVTFAIAVAKVFGRS